MAPLILGVPASKRLGKTSQEERSRLTEEIMLPPKRKAGMRSKSSLLPHKTPIPVGLNILWPEKAKKSTPKRWTSVFKWGTPWAPSKMMVMGPWARAKRTISSTGLIVPKTLETQVKVKSLGLWVRASCRESRSKVPSGRISIQRS